MKSIRITSETVTYQGAAFPPGAILLINQRDADRLVREGKAEELNVPANRIYK